MQGVSEVSTNKKGKLVEKKTKVTAEAVGKGSTSDDDQDSLNVPNSEHIAAASRCFF